MMKEFLVSWQDAAAAAGTIIALLSIIIAIIVLEYTRRANRRRATLDMVLQTLLDQDAQKTYKKFRELIRKDQDTEDAFKIVSLSQDEHIGTKNRKLVNHQLNVYELMALGIRKKLFDETLYKGWYHNQFMMDYEGAQDFIKARQENKSSIYCEMSALYASWLKDGHPVSSPNRFKMAWWAFRRQHNKIDKARATTNAR